MQMMGRTKGWWLTSWVLAAACGEVDPDVEARNGGLELLAATDPPPPGRVDEVRVGLLLLGHRVDHPLHALQRHFGVRLAFQNCHRVAVFPLDLVDAFDVRTPSIFNAGDGLVRCLAFYLMFAPAGAAPARRSIATSAARRSSVASWA